MHRSRGNRIGIISESVLFRAGLKALLRDTDFEAAFEAANVDGLLPGREEASGADIFLLDSGARSARLAEDVRDLLRTVDRASRSEEHTSELQSLMRSSYAVFCLKKKNN